MASALRNGQSHRPRVITRFRREVAVDFLVFQVAADDDFIFGPTLYLQPLKREPESARAAAPLVVDLTSASPVAIPHR